MTIGVLNGAYMDDAGNEKLVSVEDETITGGLILGYSEAGAPIREPLERRGNPVTWVEK